MAEDVQHFQVTCPAGTPKATPVLTKLGIPPRTVSRIDWRVPNGPMGTTGFLLSMGGVAVLPFPNQLTFVVANGETGVWELDDYPDSGAWECQMYNTGANAHSVYLTFHMDLPARSAELRALIPPHELSSAPDLSMAGPPVAGIS